MFWVIEVLTKPFSRLPKLDLYVAGFPCNIFSIARAGIPPTEISKALRPSFYACCRTIVACKPKIFIVDHCEIELKKKKYAVLLVLDGATNLLWATAQNSLDKKETLVHLREWNEQNNCIPKAIVGDEAFFSDEFNEYYKFHGIKALPCGPRTPWPNRAETAVRLFKRQWSLMTQSLEEDERFNGVTIRQAVKMTVWARNTQLTISGYSPLEVATGRRPPDLCDVETANPEQLSATPPDEDLSTLALSITKTCSKSTSGSKAVSRFETWHGKKNNLVYSMHTRDALLLPYDGNWSSWLDFIMWVKWSSMLQITVPYSLANGFLCWSLAHKCTSKSLSALSISRRLKRLNLGDITEKNFKQESLLPYGGLKNFHLHIATCIRRIYIPSFVHEQSRHRQRGTSIRTLITKKLHIFI